MVLYLPRCSFVVACFSPWDTDIGKSIGFLYLGGKWDGSLFLVLDNVWGKLIAIIIGLGEASLCPLGLILVPICGDCCCQLCIHVGVGVCAYHLLTLDTAWLSQSMQALRLRHRVP